MEVTISSGFVSALINSGGDSADFSRNTMDENPWLLPLIGDPTNHVPLSWFEKFATQAARGQSLGSLALRAGGSTKPGHFGLLELIYITSPNLFEAFKAIEPFWEINGTPTGTFLDIENRMAFVASEPTYHLMQHFFSVFRVANFTSQLESVTGVSFHPVEMQFSASEENSEECHKYAEQLKCSVSFGAPIDRLVFERTCLQTPFLGANKMLHQIFLELGNAKLSKIKSQQNLDRTVVNLIEKQLISRRPQLASVARTLGMSARTLQRRLLKDHNVSFTVLIEEVLKQKAVENLLSGISLKETSYKLRFRSPTALHRAFQRWYGCTPRQFLIGIDSGSQANVPDIIPL